MDWFHRIITRFWDLKMICRMYLEDCIAFHKDAPTQSISAAVFECDGVLEIMYEMLTLSF